MKFVLRTILALALLINGIVFIAFTLVTLNTFFDAVVAISRSSSSNKTAYHVGEILAFLGFVVIAYFSIRTGIRIFKKSKKMREEPEDSMDILDDMA